MLKFKEPINTFEGIEPEQLELEKSFASPLDREQFSEYSSITSKNVPQLEGEVYRRTFGAKTFLQEKKIEELQQEYDRFIYKINQLNDTLEPLKLKNRNILNEYGNIEMELSSVKQEIENIEKDFSILKNKYREEIKKKEFKLFKQILIIGAVAFVFGAILPHLIKSLSFLINSPIIPIIYFVYSSLMILSHITQRDKYLSKLEKEFMQTEDYQNYQKQLDEKTKEKEQIEQKLNLKGKELEDSSKEINIVKYQIDILIRNIKRIKEDLIELILPDSKNIETKYQFSETLTQEKTGANENKLARKLIPTE